LQDIHLMYFSVSYSSYWKLSAKCTCNESMILF